MCRDSGVGRDRPPGRSRSVARERRGVDDGPLSTSCVRSGYPGSGGSPAYWLRWRQLAGHRGDDDVRGRALRCHVAIHGSSIARPLTFKGRAGLVGRIASDPQISDRSVHLTQKRDRMDVPSPTRAPERERHRWCVPAGRRAASAKTCDSSVTEDWFVEAVEQVVSAGQAACEALNAAVEALEEGRRARLAGNSILEVVDRLIGGGGREIRFASAEAFREFERAVLAMRAGVVRSLIDDHGLSLTAVASRLNVSRQAAARLYRSGSG